MHEITEKTKEVVSILAGHKVSQAEIARVLAVSVDTLKRHYRDDLRLGNRAGNSFMCERLIDLARKIQASD